MTSGRLNAVKVVGICGSILADSHTHALVRVALQAAADSGADTALIDLNQDILPLMHPEQLSDSTEQISSLRKIVNEADAFIIGSPEYHGSMSGSLKNFFDYYHHEFAGKLVGLVASTGGSMGTSVLEHMRTTCLYLHSWTLP